MISRFLLLVSSFTKKEAFKQFTNFFNNTQIFHPLFLMLYTGNLGLRYCVGFLQIQSHIGCYVPIIQLIIGAILDHDIIIEF